MSSRFFDLLNSMIYDLKRSLDLRCYTNFAKKIPLTMEVVPPYRLLKLFTLLTLLTRLILHSLLSLLTLLYGFIGF